MNSPLSGHVVFRIGPVGIDSAVLVTWALMVVLVGGSWLATRRLTLRPGRAQAALELVVATVADQITQTVGREPGPLLPLVGTLFLFILASNWSSLVPGVEPPTARLETDAALALITFGAIVWFGVRARGLGGYLRSFAEPSFVMIPLNLVETITRTFSMMIRLFGNVMAGVFIIGIVLSLAGLLLPIPLMALELLTGAVQAYIFAILALVFIGGALGSEAAPDKESKAA